LPARLGQVAAAVAVWRARSVGIQHIVMRCKVFQAGGGGDEFGGAGEIPVGVAWFGMSVRMPVAVIRVSSAPKLAAQIAGRSRRAAPSRTASRHFGSTKIT